MGTQLYMMPKGIKRQGMVKENLDLVADPENNFVVIMKDGKIYMNTKK